MIIQIRNKPDEERYEKYLESAMDQRNIMDVAYAANKFNISTVSNGAGNGSGDIRRIIAPVLVLWGKNDVITTEQMTLEIINDMKGTGIDVTYSILSAGHAVLIDNLEAVLMKIDKFLSS
ncbi:alpha/beta fold hydrolase [Virgibacillus oceani]